ncbi:uncharacterized protein [Dysidea avara]|uniref:uncharacterized protein n=1 Tax=Dysidea avara TaxID=196820 RepID=UPI00332031F4
MVKSVKKCLRKTIGKAKLTYEELMTALTEVEMILNSRPLSYVSSEDVEKRLTPSHLIFGRRILSLPDSDFQHGANVFDYNMKITHDTFSRRMDHLNKTLNHFWRRWEEEYLLQFRESHRYSGTTNHKTNVLQEGQVVLMYSEGSPRGFWKLARIHTLIKGEDGHVREESCETNEKQGEDDEKSSTDQPENPEPFNDRNMMKTLAFFMTPDERKLSRMLTADTRQLEYLRDLYVQGFIHTGKLKRLPVKIIHLRLSVFAPTIIDMNSLEVNECCTVESFT